MLACVDPSKRLLSIGVIMASHTDKTSDTIHAVVYFTPAQLSSRWSCSLMKLRRMRRAGTLAVSYLGRAARYRVEDVLRIEADARA